MCIQSVSWWITTNQIALQHKRMARITEKGVARNPSSGGCKKATNVKCNRTYWSEKITEYRILDG